MDQGTTLHLHGAVDCVLQGSPICHDWGRGIYSSGGIIWLLLYSERAVNSSVYGKLKRQKNSYKRWDLEPYFFNTWFTDFFSKY